MNRTEQEIFEEELEKYKKEFRKNRIKIMEEIEKQNKKSLKIHNIIMTLFYVTMIILFIIRIIGAIKI